MVKADRLPTESQEWKGTQAPRQTQPKTAAEGDVGLVFDRAPFIKVPLTVLELNPDFSLKGMTAQAVTPVVKAWQSGALSRDSMLDPFRRGDILPGGPEQRGGGRPHRGRSAEV